MPGALSVGKGERAGHQLGRRAPGAAADGGVRVRGSAPRRRHEPGSGLSPAR